MELESQKVEFALVLVSRWIPNRDSRLSPHFIQCSDNIQVPRNRRYKTTNMVRKVLQTNDPVLALIALSESDFFSKIITNENHPLHPEGRK